MKRRSTLMCRGLATGLALLAVVMMLPATAGAQHRARIEIVPHLDHTGLVLAAAFSTDGPLFLSGGEDATLKLWDGATLRLIRNFVGHSGAVVAVAFSPDGTRVLSGSRDGTMRLWDTATGQSLLTIRPAGRSRDTATTVWDAATGRPLFTIPPSNDFSRMLGVSSVAFSPDGKHLLLGTERGGAMLWEAASGRLVQTFEHAKPAYGRVVTVAFSPDGTRVLTGGKGEKTAKLWDAATGQLIQAFGDSAVGKDQDLKGVSLVLSPDGTRILTGPKGYGNRVVRGNTSLSLWEVATGRLIRTMGGDPRGVAFAAFSQDGTLMVTSGDKRGHNALNYWDLETGGLIRTRGFTAKGELVSFTVLAISADGARVLSGGVNDWMLRDDDVLRLWDVATGRMLHAFVGQDPVHSVAVSPAGSALLSGVGNRDWRGDSVRLWEATTGRLASSKRLESSSYGITVGFSADGARAVSRQGLELKLWDGATGEHIRSFDVSAGTLAQCSVALSPDGTRLVAVSDRAFKLWNVATGQTVRTSEGRYGRAWSVAFSPDGARMVWANGKTLTVWDAVTGSHLRTLDARPMEAINAVALSPDGSHILSAGPILSYRPSGGNKVVLWDVATGQPVRIFGRHSGSVRSVTFSPDGARVLSTGELSAFGGGDTTLKLWGDAYGPPDPHTFEGHSASVTSVAFSRDGRRIFSGSRDGTLRIWDAEKGGLLATLLAARLDTWLTGEWVTVTPEGFFDTSSQARAIGILSVVRGLEVFSIDRSYHVLHRPDLVREKLAGDPDGKVKEAAADLEAKLQLK